MKRERADRLLLAQGLAQSRSQAQALLLSGRVYLGEQRIDKAGWLLAADSALSVRPGPRFVSRGGSKLEGALDTLGISVAGVVAADLGASTGGFTDCLLQRGASKVFAVDVGHGQLAPRLREDPRVVVMERTNARYLQATNLGEQVDLVVVDASFISLAKLLEAVARILKRPGQLVALVKPQFEVGRAEAARARGVIRDAAVRQHALARTLAGLRECGFRVVADCPCALPGPKGNREHFVWAQLD